MKRTLLFSVLLLATGLPAKVVADHEIADALPGVIGKESLPLRGAFIRSSFGFKGAVAALYADKAQTAESIVAGDKEVAYRQHFVFRDIPIDRLRGSLKENLMKAAGPKAKELEGDFDALLACFSGDIAKGGLLEYRYRKDRGVEVTLNGKRLGLFAKKDFCVALFSTWFGPKPVSEEMKKALLGG